MCSRRIDNELSLAVQHLGWRILQPNGCRLVTECMTTWRALARQRLRWKRGALENLVDYGVTGVTWRYWGRQALSALTVLVSVVFVSSLLASAIFGWGFDLRWLAVGGMFSVSQTVTVWKRGWKARIVAALVVVETAYDLFLQGVQGWAFVSAAFGLKREW